MKTLLISNRDLFKNRKNVNIWSSRLNISEYRNTTSIMAKYILPIKICKSNFVNPILKNIFRLYSLFMWVLNRSLWFSGMLLYKIILNLDVYMGNTSRYYIFLILPLPPPHCTCRHHEKLKQTWITERRLRTLRE